MAKKQIDSVVKFDRMARRYDLMEFCPECLWFGKHRTKVFSKIHGGTLLEVGVGTGRNIRYYPNGVKVTAIDFSEEMVKRARVKAAELNSALNLLVMDAQELKFEQNSFDAVISTCVFCSVPDPVRGLSEVRRVLKPDGAYYALEHVRPKGRILGKLFDLIAPFIAERTGVHINRNTVENIRKAGFEIETEENLVLDIVKFIVARPRKAD